MSITNLYLIRHAQAVVNVTGTMAGPRGDTGLTALGVRQAEALRERLEASGEVPAEVFLSSTLPRARQTAEIIAPAIGLPILFDDDLQEFRVGPDADGLALDDYKRRYGWIDFEKEPFKATDPGAESWATFQGRIGRTLTRLVDEHAGKTLLIVTHGGIIDGAFRLFFGFAEHEVPPVRLHTRNTSLTHWRREPREGKPVWRLVRYNDAHHLRGLSGLDD